MLPTPLPEAPGSLEERVHEHREALTDLMADAGRCDDILSGDVDLIGTGDIDVL